MKISYKNKIVLLYILIIVIPCFIVVVYLNVSIYRSVSEKATDDIMLMLRQMNNSVDFKMNIYERVLNILCFDEDIQNVLSEKDRLPLAQDISDEKKLFNILDTAQYNHGLSSARLYVHSKKIYANQNYTFFNMEKISDKPWYLPATENEGKVYWYIDDELINGVNVVKGVCMLKNISGNFERIGYLEISVPLNDFFDFEIDSNEWIQNTLVIDEDNRIVACDEKKKIGEKAENIEDINFPQNDSGKIWNKSRSNFVLFINIRNTKWKLITCVTKNDLIKFEKLTTMSMTINTILCISIVLLAFLLMYFVIKRTVCYIQKIHKLIDDEDVSIFENLEDNLRLSSDKYDFDLLEYKVNAVVKELKNKIEDAYVLKINERNAMLKALQEQINPHFIYNTLDTLNWMAFDYCVPQINEMIDALAKYCRISLSNGRDIIRLKEEIDLTKAYFKIQKKRYEDRFSVNYDINENFLDCAFPKLTLQPIVENALIHGLNKEDKEQKLLINIEVKEDEEDLLIVVTDNGIGIDEQTLEQMFNGTLQTNECLQGGYGIYNVYNRIKVFCDEESKYGLFIKSAVGKGTVVTLKIKNFLYSEKEES